MIILYLSAIAIIISVFPAFSRAANFDPLQNTIYQSPNTAGPNPYYATGVNDLFPSVDTSLTLPSYSIGQTILIYLRFIKKSSTYTSIFYPTVDDYSQLTVPNSWPLLSTDAGAASVTNTSLILYYAGRFLPLPYLAMSLDFDGETFYVPSRTALVTLTSGIVTDFKWSPTACVLTDCICLDNICASLCTAQNCNLTIHIAFVGTDNSGTYLTSFNRDIYRFENAF